MALKGVHQGHVPEHPVPAGRTLATLRVGDVVVATYCDGADLPAVLAPRPFLHPVTTLSGRPVTDAQPEDHRWHLGVSVTLQDVGGANIWGGRTYLAGEGYTWRADHGRQLHTGWRSRDATGFTETLEWRGPRGEVLLTEERTLRARAADLPGGWTLDLSTRLCNATGAQLQLGSPATHGRSGAGYGGLFWRLPTAPDARVATADAEGEDAVHGAVAPWVAYSAGGPDPVTVALAGLDDQARADPWFVRVADYPGLGSQLAAERPVLLAPGEETTRSFRALIADGTPGPDGITRALTAAAEDGP
ncbi:PmoA family protein [Blastococcus sp. SYSU DS0753]